MATNLMDLMKYGQNQYEVGRQQGNRSKLAQLAGQAYGAPRDQRQGLVQQAIGVDPQSGFALDKNLQGGDDQKMQRVQQLAGSLVAMPAQMRPQAYASVMQELHGLGLGEGLPPAWSDDLLPYAQQLATGVGSGGNVQSTYIDAQGNRVAIMRDGTTQVLGQNAPSNQIIDTGNGFYGVNKGNLQAAPVMTGVQSPQQQQAPQQPAGGVPINVQYTGPEEDRAAFMASVNADQSMGAPQGDYKLSGLGGDVSPSQRGFPAQGGQLRSAPKPAAAPTQLQLNADQRDAERLRLAQEDVARKAADGGATPAQRFKMQQTQRKEKMMLTANDAQVDGTVKLIDGILARGNDLSGVTGIGSALSKIPGTDYADVAAMLDTLKGRSAFGALQQMRANSPTGGALGQVSERELYLLQNAETQLQSSQSPGSLKRALQTYRGALLESKKRMRDGVSEFYSEQAPAQGGSVAPAQSGGGANSNVADPLGIL